MHRLRIRFGRGEEIKYISHLDIMRLWERALRRAQIPLAYTEGFNPHPRLSLAAPLPLAVTSEAELMDVFTARMVTPHWFTGVITPQLPIGIEIIGVNNIAPNAPSLQSLVRHIEYRVEFETEKEKEDIESAIASLLSAEHLPWYHQRDTGRRSYDLRALIDDLWFIEKSQSCCTIGMKLRCDSSGTGRPEQVTSALGFQSRPHSMHRTRLFLAL